MKFTYGNGGRVVKALQWVITTAMFAIATILFIEADGYGAEAHMVFGLFGSMGYLAYVTSFIAKPGIGWSIQSKVSDIWLNLIEVLIAIVWLALSVYLCLVSRDKIDIAVPVEAYVAFGAIYGAGFFSMIILFLAEKNKNGKEGMVLVGLSLLIWWPAILGLISWREGQIISDGYGYSHKGFPAVMSGASIFLVAFNSFGEAFLAWFGRRADNGWRPPRALIQAKSRELPPPKSRDVRPGNQRRVAQSQRFAPGSADRPIKPVEVADFETARERILTVEEPKPVSEPKLEPVAEVVEPKTDATGGLPKRQSARPRPVPPPDDKPEKPASIAEETSTEGVLAALRKRAGLVKDLTDIGVPEWMAKKIAEGDEAGAEKLLQKALSFKGGKQKNAIMALTK